MRATIFSLTAALALAACGSSSSSSTTGVPTDTPSPSPKANSSPTATQTVGPPHLSQIGTYDNPIALVSPPHDQHTYVVEKGGRVRLFGPASQAPFLDISGDVSGDTEQGLLGLAFAPDWSTSHLVYVYYTDRSGNIQIAEFTAQPDGLSVVAASRRPILEIDKAYPNHNGGQLAFDLGGMLLIGVGDGGSEGDPDNRGQSLNTLLGKILRIDPRHHGAAQAYSVPPDNPYATSASAKPEIWMYGLRNPWRFSIDSDGTMYIGDVGQDTVEEVDAVPTAQQAGANLGWRAREGDIAYSGEQVDTTHLIGPVYTYRHARGACAIIGGFVVHNVKSGIDGHYIFGDLCTGALQTLTPPITYGQSAQQLNLKVTQLSSFGTDSAGNLYAISLSGPVYLVAGA